MPKFGAGRTVWLPDILFTELIGVDKLQLHRAVKDHDTSRQDDLRAVRGCQRLQSSPSAIDHQVRIGRSVGVTKTGHCEWTEPSRVGRLNVKQSMIIVRFDQDCQAPSNHASTAGTCHLAQINSIL